MAPSAHAIIVFELFKRNGKVYIEIVPDCSAKALQTIIHGYISIESVIHSGVRRDYDGLVDAGREKRFRAARAQGNLRMAHVLTALKVLGLIKNNIEKIPWDTEHIFLFAS